MKERHPYKWQNFCEKRCSSEAGFCGRRRVMKEHDKDQHILLYLDVCGKGVKVHGGQSSEAWEI